MKFISVITLSLIGLAVAMPGIEKVGLQDFPACKDSSIGSYTYKFFTSAVKTRTARVFEMTTAAVIWAVVCWKAKRDACVVESNFESFHRQVVFVGEMFRCDDSTCVGGFNGAVLQDFSCMYI